MPLSIVDSQAFNKLVRAIYYADRVELLKMPSANTVMSDIKSKYNQMKESVKILLQSQGRISFTTDAWTSPNAYGTAEYLGIVAHFVDENWEARQMLIGFEPLEQNHTGNF